jgi:hypothetical protein
VDVIERGLSETHLEYPPPVRCQVEHVSLDGFTHKYLSFLEGSKEESRTADLYVIWTKSLLDQWPHEYPDDLKSDCLAGSQDLGNYLRI